MTKNLTCIIFNQATASRGSMIIGFYYGERGEVKIEGKIWTAIANENINNGDKVIVLAIKGVKLVVRKE